MFQLYNVREDVQIASDGIEAKKQETEEINRRLEENDELILSKQADLSKAQTNSKKMEKKSKKQKEKLNEVSFGIGKCENERD